MKEVAGFLNSECDCPKNTSFQNPGYPFDRARIKCWRCRLRMKGKVSCPECAGDGRVQKFLDRTFSNRCPRCNGYGYMQEVE